MPLTGFASAEPALKERADPALAGRILVVVVLYNKRFDEIPCAAKIQGWLDAPVGQGAGLHLAHCLVYDNSPAPSPPGRMAHARMSGLHDPGNGGTRAAYLAAADMARLHQCPWILLLDHDTDLPADFLTAAEHALVRAEAGQTVAAVVPQVFDGGIQVSPSWITTYGRVLQISDRGEGGHRRGKGFTAIASAAMVQTHCLSALLPIPEVFKLDYLDHWLFREIQRRGGVVVMSTAKINHSLSVFSMQSMGLERYRSILAAERLFLRGDHSYSRVKHALWHLVRTVKLALVTRRVPLLGVCVRAAKNIIRGP